MKKPTIRESTLAALTLALAATLAGCSSDDARASTEPTGDSGATRLGPPSDGGGGDASVEITLTQIPVGDFVFDARVAGPEDGEVVFLLHGFPSTSHQWRHQLVALARAGYRAIAPDQRGYSPGARPPNVEDYAVINLVGDVLGMADAVGADRFHLVGHDWGGGVGWATAGLAKARVISYTSVATPHPDAVAEMLADDTSCQHEHSSYFDTFVQPEAFHIFIDNDAALLKATFTGVAAEDVAVYVEALGNEDAMKAALSWYAANIENRQFKTPTLGTTTIPSRLVYGGAEEFFCLETAEATVKYVSHPYELEVLPGVNHWLTENAPDEVSAAILKTIASADL